MAWTNMKLKRQHSYPGLSFRTSGLYFNSEFITANKLENSWNVEFLRNDDNPYMLGFRFFEQETALSLTLSSSGRDKGTKGRTLKANTLRTDHKIVGVECKLASDPFPIVWDKVERLYYVELRPNFNIRIKWNDINQISDDASGIYRYLDREKTVQYIGKGNIRSRAAEPERRDWNVEHVEYSIIDDDQIAFEWESFYINEHIERFGYKPVFNRIRGKGLGT